MVRSIGIDSGDRAVHVVELDGSYRKTRLVSARSSAIGGSDDPMRPDIVSDAVREALDAGAKGQMTLGHPAREAVLRTIELPFKGADAIKKVVKSEIEGEVFSHAVEDTVVDFHEIGEGASGGTRILVGAVPKIGIRNQLNSLSAQGVDPESVDLDTMALWRAADWVGAFEAGDVEDGAAEPVHVVMDLGARSVKVLLVEGDRLVDMRVLRLGDHVVADQVARQHGIHSEQARIAVADSLATGEDSRVEISEAAPPAAPAEEASGEAGSAGEEAAAEAVSSVPQASEVIPFAEVEAANTKYLKRLARELTRFLAATGLASRIGSVWTCGSACRGQGVSEMLAAVFGSEPRELDVLAHLAHDLDEAEAAERSPELAVAVGLALGRLGGPVGFELRQEDLAQSGGFDAVKFPLAIACMVGLLTMFVFFNKKSMELDNLELELGRQHEPGTAVFHGMLNPIFRPKEKWFEDKRNFSLKDKNGRTSYKYKDLLAEVEAAPVHARVGIVRRKLREVAKQKQKESGVYEDVSLESGLSVLVRWAEMLKGVEGQLGRYLVSSIDLDMGASKPHLTFTVAFRGEDFRSRMAVLQRAITLESGKPDSPFLPPDNPTPPETMFKPDKNAAQGVQEGAYYDFKMPIKSSFEPFGKSMRVGAAERFGRERDYLAAAGSRGGIGR